jgi:hypothetical protein
LSKQYLSRFWKSPVEGVAGCFASADVVGEASGTVVSDVGKKPNRKRIENRNTNIDRPKKAAGPIGKRKSDAGWD